MTTLHLDYNISETLQPLVDNNSYPQLLTSADIENILRTTLEHIKATDTNLITPADNKPTSVSVYLVEETEGRELNNDYRGKDYATNVLSFESDMPEMMLELIDEQPLGELVICIPVVEKQAQEQNKTFADHYTHLLIHGCLHLMGYDHELSDTITQQDAEHMENLEISIMNKLGLENPYKDDYKV